MTSTGSRLESKLRMQWLLRSRRTRAQQHFPQDAEVGMSSRNDNELSIDIVVSTVLTNAQQLHGTSNGISNAIRF